MNELTVCIPAHNEGRCIGRTIESILNQRFCTPTSVEILVGANACTDNTIDVANSYRRDGNIGVFEIPEKGKARAWNFLRTNSKTDRVIFCDGDVYLDKDSLSNISNKISQTDKIIVGGTGHPYYMDLPLFGKISCWFMCHPPEIQDYISGPLYGFSQERLNERLKMRGVSKMPDDTIGDDHWLQLMVGSEGFIIDPESRVYYRPRKISEFPRVRRRIKRQHIQLRERYPELYERENQNRRESYLKRVRKCQSIGSAFHYIIAGTFRKVLGKGIDMMTPRECEFEWGSCESTKQPIYVQ